MSEIAKIFFTFGAGMIVGAFWLAVALYYGTRDKREERRKKGLGRGGFGQ